MEQITKPSVGQVFDFVNNCWFMFFKYSRIREPHWFWIFQKIRLKITATYEPHFVPANKKNASTES